MGDVKLYMPQVFGNAPAGQGEVVHMTPRAAEFAQVWMARLGDRAARMRVDSRLVKCAQEHALFLSQRTGAEAEQSMHIGKFGTLPNERVLAVGYELPDFYRPHANNVESCAADHRGPDVAVEMLLASPSHRPMMMGERVSDWFWHRHVVWGVGHSMNFYTVLVCPPEGEM